MPIEHVVNPAEYDAHDGTVGAIFVRHLLTFARFATFAFYRVFE